MTTPRAARAPAPRGHPRARRRGFTLLELTFVVVISAIVLTVGVIRISRLGILSSQAERAARRLAADLRYAHSQAVTHAANHDLRFETDGHTVQAGPDPQVEPTRTLHPSIALTGAPARAEFAPGGDALAACTYSVASQARSYTVAVVLATGAVTVQEP